MDFVKIKMSIHQKTPLENEKASQRQKEKKYIYMTKIHKESQINKKKNQTIPFLKIGTDTSPKI